MGPPLERVLRIGWRVERDYPHLRRVRHTVTERGRVLAEVCYVLLSRSAGALGGHG